MTDEDLSKLQDLVIQAVQTGNFNRARDLIAKVAAESVGHRDLIAKQKALLAKLADRLEPPLTRALVLGPSPDDERNVLVGGGGQRLEVRIAAENLAPRDLAPGQEAWLNQDRCIVKVRPPGGSGEAADVVAVLPDGRLEVKGRGNDAIIVDRLPPLRAVEINGGDRVRFDPQLAVAIEKLPQQENRELELDAVPKVTYADIGGLDEHIEQVREAIELPYLYQHLFHRYRLRRPKGVLLYGPPGCGKTLIAKAIANSLTTEISRNLRDIRDALALLVRLRRDGAAGEPAVGAAYAAWRQQVFRQGAGEAAAPADAITVTGELTGFLAARGIDPGDGLGELEAQHRLFEAKLEDRPQAYFISIKGPELLDKYVGETEHSIRKLFQQAKRRASTATPVVMFFDEIEALFRRRGSRVSSDVESTIVPQFLSEMDGVEELSNVIIIGATNRQDLLDPAIVRPGRLDAKIKVDRPGRAGARRIFAKYLLPELPIAAAEIAAAGSPAAAADSLIERAVALIYSDTSAYQVTGTQVEGGAKTLPCRDFMSGAMIESIVSRHKRRAVKREIDSGLNGLSWSDLEEAIREEFEQNKDQLVAAALNLSEAGLTIELALSTGAAESPESSWLQPLHRPWVRARPAPAAVAR
jgi:proteasome-associated ATPase